MFIWPHVTVKVKVGIGSNGVLFLPVIQGFHLGLLSSSLGLGFLHWIICIPIKQEVFCARPGGGICDFCPHLFGQNSDTEHVCQEGMSLGRKGNSLVSIHPYYSRHPTSLCSEFFVVGRGFGPALLRITPLL